MKRALVIMFTLCLVLALAIPVTGYYCYKQGRMDKNRELMQGLFGDPSTRIALAVLRGYDMRYYPSGICTYCHQGEI